MGHSRKDPDAVQRGRREQFVSDNSKCFRTSEGGGGVNFQTPLGELWMFSGMTQCNLIEMSSLLFLFKE